MTIKLRQSTASQEVPLGYFLDSTDGNTEETALTIANTDIKLWKMGATTLANKNSGGATHISNGVYYAVLDATDTNTLGALVVFVHVAGALPVRVECEVLPAVVYDALIAGTDNLQVDTVQINGTAQTAGDVVADTNDIQARLPAALVGGRIDANMGAISGDAAAADNLETAYDDTAGPVTWHGIIDQGTAQSATGTTLVLRSAAAFANDELIGATIVITGGSAGVGQSREITDYVSSTDTATVDAWTTTPTGTITYKIFAGPPAPTTPPAVNVTQVIGDPIVTSSAKTTNWGGTA